MSHSDGVDTGDSLGAENMPTGNSVGSPLAVVGFVADVAIRIRMNYKHLWINGTDDPYTGGGGRRGRARVPRGRVRKNPG